MRKQQLNLWMPWYVRDYLAKTMHLTTEQHGALLLLLGAYWTNQGPIPDDDAWLAGTTRLAPKVWAKHRPVISAFFTVEAGVWKQSRADEEIEQNRITRERRREGGRKTASTRWGKQHLSNASFGSSAGSSATPEQVAHGLVIPQSQSQSQSQYSSPLSSPSTEAPCQQGEDDEEELSSKVQNSDRESIARAELVWAVWPKKIETLPALLEVRHAIRRHGFDQVMEGTRAIVAADARRNSPAARGRYLPKPVEFFANSRYLDDPSQYGPPALAMDAQALRKAIEDLTKLMADHPGNPDNTIGSLDRKKAAGGEYKALRARWSDLRDQLKSLEATENDGGQVT